MRKTYWSTEEVPAEEFIRRLLAWLCDPSCLSAAVRLNARQGLFRLTLTNVVTPDDGVQTELIRSSTTPFLEVEHAVRALSGPSRRIPEVGLETGEAVESQLSWDDIDKAPEDPPEGF